MEAEPERFRDGHGEEGPDSSGAGGLRGRRTTGSESEHLCSSTASNLGADTPRRWRNRRGISRQARCRTGLTCSRPWEPLTSGQLLRRVLPFCATTVFSHLVQPNVEEPSQGLRGPELRNLLAARLGVDAELAERVGGVPRDFLRGASKVSRLLRLSTHLLGKVRDCRNV